MKLTLVSLTITVDHIIERLGRRAGLDPDGLELLHEATNLATILQAAKERALARVELLEVVDRTARLDVNVKAYISARRAARLADRLPHSQRPTDETQAQMRAALEGPQKVTLVACPKCCGCTLCSDTRLVTPAIAADFELKNVPRRDRATLAPQRKAKGEP